MNIVFMGTPEFAVPVLNALIEHSYNVVGVVTQPDKKVGRKQILTPPPVKQRAMEANIPVFQPVKIREDYQQVIDWQPDLIVTCAYGQIIPKSLLDCPRLGAINVHASLLPKYRGGAPIQWAIMNGEKETGMTVMYMAEKMDAGDIIKMKKIPIHESDNNGTMHDKLSQLGAELLIETLPSIIDGTNERIPQNEEEVTYAYNISKSDEWLDFNKPSEAVFNHIRGLDPWPGCYALMDGERFKIYESTIVSSNSSEQPGTIIAIEKDFITVKTIDGAIQITTGQLAGRKRQAMRDILNGKHPFEIGKIFNQEN